MKNDFVNIIINNPVRIAFLVIIITLCVKYVFNKGNEVKNEIDQSATFSIIAISVSAITLFLVFVLPKICSWIK